MAGRLAGRASIRPTAPCGRIGRSSPSARARVRLAASADGVGHRVPPQHRHRAPRPQGTPARRHTRGRARTHAFPPPLSPSPKRTRGRARTHARTYRLRRRTDGGRWSGSCRLRYIYIYVYILDDIFTYSPPPQAFLYKRNTREYR